MIDEKIKEYILNDEKHSDGYYIDSESEYHVSSLGGCPRIIYFDKTDYIGFGDDTKKVFLIGDIFHGWVQENLLKDYSIEEKVTKEIDGVKLKGKMDAHNKDEIIELKTTSYLSSVRKPKEEHITQINTYMGITGIHKGRMIYIEKNTLNIKEFDVKFSNALFEDTLKTIKVLDKMIKDKVGFKQVTPRMSYNCYTCKYKRKCLSLY